MACHLIDTPSVGPSLIQIAGAYPSGKTAEFIAWTQSPGKKDPSLIAMPPMNHVSEQGLRRIHEYILKATVGKMEKKREFPPVEEAKPDLPYVIRGFLPDASPASIAVIINDDVSLCWDTETCRLRYAWEGSDAKIGGFRGPAELPSPFYRENAKQLWSFGEKCNPRFLGYRIIEGYPEFHYAFGEIEIREKISCGETVNSIARHFTVQGAKSPVTLNLSHAGDVDIVPDKGVLAEGILHLTVAQAMNFSISILKK